MFPFLPAAVLIPPEFGVLSAIALRLPIFFSLLEVNAAAAAAMVSPLPLVLCLFDGAWLTTRALVLLAFDQGPAQPFCPARWNLLPSSQELHLLKAFAKAALSPARAAGDFSAVQGTVLPVGLGGAVPRQRVGIKPPASGVAAPSLPVFSSCSAVVD